MNRKEKIIHIEFIAGSKEKSKLLQELLLQDKNLYTVAVGLMSLGETEFARFAAGSIIIAIPIIILYFCLVKYMINGMSSGAVKE